MKNSSSAQRVMENKNRLEWLDAVRGVGITLVVLGHTALPPIGYVLIYAFHVPLFFIVAGYLFNPDREVTATLKARFLGLMVPYYLYSLGMFAFVYIAGEKWEKVLLGGRVLSAELWRGTLLGTSPIIYPTWFLPCLFVSNAGLVALGPLLRRGGRGLLLCGVSAMALAQIWLVFRWPALPFRLHLAPLGILFLVAGMAWRRSRVFTEGNPWRFATMAVVLGIAFVCVALWQGRVDMNSYKIRCVPLFFITGCLGTSVVVLGCKFAESVFPVMLRPLAYLGRRSLEILVVHEGISRGGSELLRQTIVEKWHAERLVIVVLLLVTIEMLNVVTRLGKRIL